MRVRAILGTALVVVLLVGCANSPFNEAEVRAAFHECIGQRALESFDRLEKPNLRWRSRESYWVKRSVEYGMVMCGMEKKFDEAYDFDSYRGHGGRERQKELLERFGPQLKEAFREKRRQIESA